MKDGEAEIRAQVRNLFGSEEAARQWLNTPAIALDRRRPLDLLSSARGAERVEQLLRRLEYGVYT